MTGTGITRARAGMRLRPTGLHREMTGWIVLATALALGLVLGLMLRRREGRLRATMSGADVLTADEIGGELGRRATLVQFSTAFCQPCRATRRVLADVSGMVDGVRHVEIDAESNLDLVRRLKIARTPTVLVLDATGRVVRRASGLPRKPDVIAALGEAQ